MEWMQKDEAAMGSILSTCEDSQHAFILQCVLSKGMWAKLKKVHVENQTKVNIHYHFEELFMRKYVNDTLMTDHITEMLNIKHRITQAGKDLKDLIVAQAIIISLPKTQTWEFVKSVSSRLKTSPLKSSVPDLCRRPIDTHVKKVQVMSPLFRLTVRPRSH